MSIKKANSTLDILKFLCAILILGSHCLPILKNEMFNLYYGQWFFRFAVPLFFISSGYFFSRMDAEKKKTYIKRIFMLYIGATAVYSPFIASTVLNRRFFEAVKQVFLGYSHLWYLSALFIGLLVFYYFEKKNVLSKINRTIQYLTIATILLVGAFFGEYYKLVDIPLITAVGEFIKKLGGIRHAPFFGIPLIWVGRCIAETNIENKCSLMKCGTFLAGAVLLSLGEFLFLKQQFGTALRCDLTLFNWLPAVPLFVLSFHMQVSVKTEFAHMLRKMADVVYIIHPWIIFCCGSFRSNIGWDSYVR